MEDLSLSLNNYTLTVNDFMSNWTLQSGYPVLEITKNSTSNMFSVIQVNKQILLRLNLKNMYFQTIGTLHNDLSILTVK
jgi:hypothetical protein